MMLQSAGGWHVSGSGETTKKRKWVNRLHDHLLTVNFCSYELSIKWQPSQDLRCRGLMVSAVRRGVIGRMKA